MTKPTLLPDCDIRDASECLLCAKSLCHQGFALNPDNFSPENNSKTTFFSYFGPETKVFSALGPIPSIVLFNEGRKAGISAPWWDGETVAPFELIIKKNQRRATLRCLGVFSDGYGTGAFGIKWPEITGGVSEIGGRS